MDIKPTTVEVKDVVILSPGGYGGEVTFQVVSVDSATAPLRIPLNKLKEFAEKVLAIDPLLSSSLQPLEAPVLTPLDIEVVS